MEAPPGSPEGHPADRPKTTRRRKDPQRTRVSNGSELLPGVDGRSVWIRRCRELLEMHLVDLAGEENTSTAERSIIRRASVLTVELEQLECKFATAGRADPNDLDLYQRTANSLRRLLEAVGLERRPRDVTPPSLEEITDERREAEEVA